MVPLEPLAAFRVADPQKDPVDGFITTAFGNGFTVMIKLFEVAGEPVKQGVALEVKTHVTASPLFKLDVTNVGELVPAFTPLICH